MSRHKRGRPFLGRSIINAGARSHSRQVGTSASASPVRENIPPTTRPKSHSPVGQIGMTALSGPPPLRVLLASQEIERLELMATVVVGLGHEVVAREVDAVSIGVVTARECPDVALVWLGLSSQHALDMIERIVQESTCPVITLLSADEPTYIREAARRGVFAYIVDTSADQLQSAIDITLQRFAEYHDLQGAFGRRAVIEQAKGIMMGRHSVGPETAYQMLRDHSQHTGRKLADVAAAVVDSHMLLTSQARGPTHR
jgi:AmiR/NasT family two-component response regulator